MKESPELAIQALKIITDFLTNNSITIVVIVLLIVCRGAISNLISRLTSLTYKTKGSELGMEAAAPSNDKEYNSDSRTADEKPSFEDKDTEIEKKEERLFPEMYVAFDEGRFDDAEAAFKKYALDEKDDVKLEENRAFYLYLRFEKAKDNSAIDELEQLSGSAKTEDSKFNTLMWLSFCLRDGMQYHKESELWRAATEHTKSESLKTKSIVNLAYSLNREELYVEAKSLLINRLPIVGEDTQKASLYEALSCVEDSLGNKILSIYCKDKALEFDPNNRDELFNSAYAASDKDIDEISISNYIKLIRIDGDNSTALNNLGVRAQEADLKIKAVDQYKDSSKHNNTLAMANQGYLLLGAGFADEAEKIAREALEKEDAHQNVHSLLAEINERKEKQAKDWDDLSQKAISRQKMIREYTEQFYFGDQEMLKGEWKVRDTYLVTIKIEEALLQAKWVERAGALGGSTYTVEISGKVFGSTFDGKYTRKRNESAPTTLLGFDGNTKQECIGYFSLKDNEIKIISKKLKDDFYLCLSPEKA
jgi:Flp pilus assembly protein TadD